MSKFAIITKTIRQWLEYRKGISEWFTATQELFNRVVAFYFDVIQAHLPVLDLPNKQALTALERITHATKRNPDPIMPLTQVADHIPAMFRRAAINAALGAARSHQTNLEKWREEKAKVEAKGRRFTKRPPVPPRTWNRSVTFYQGMWKERENGSIVLKLWDGQTWRWVRFHLSGRDVPEGWEMGSPQAVKRGRKWRLHTPIEKKIVKPEKVETQIKNNPDTRLCTVDLNLGDRQAVCTILETDGTIIASLFIRGGQWLNGRRKSSLGRVARNRSKTGTIAEGEQDNVDLWEYIRNLDEDTAHRVSRRIVEFALKYGATIIVFEHLGNFKPKRGKYSRRSNSKRSYWLRGRIFRYTRYKAWEEGIITCRVNPRGTSSTCAHCGSPVARFGEGEPAEGYRPGAPLFQCLNPECGKRGNADLNACQNIGWRLLARYTDFIYPFYQEKPHTRPLSGRASKEAGVSFPQVIPANVENAKNGNAGNGARLHTEPERHGEQNRPGTAGGISRPLRPLRGSGYAANTPSAAYAGVPQEAAAL